MSFIRSQRETWTTSGVTGSGGRPSRRTSAGAIAECVGRAPSGETIPAAVSRATTSWGSSSPFFGVNEPDYGHLLDTMLVADGAKVRHADYCVPRVEPELTFILKEPLKGPGVGLVDVLRATEYVVPSIEIIDARVQNPRKIFDTVADNGAAAGIVLGGRPVRPHDVDLRWVGAVFYRNSEIEETGLAAGVLGHPAMAIAWLANKVGVFGTTLEPGHLMLSGSFTRPVWANPGDTLHADFGRLGSVAVQFV